MATAYSGLVHDLAVLIHGDSPTPDDKVEIIEILSRHNVLVLAEDQRCLVYSRDKVVWTGPSVEDDDELRYMSAVVSLFENEIQDENMRRRILTYLMDRFFPGVKSLLGSLREECDR